jgi:dienelactone hydrolase
MGTGVELTAPDGRRRCGYRAEPAAAGGRVVLQEIFGITRHIPAETDEWAAADSLPLAPVLIDRAERRRTARHGGYYGGSINRYTGERPRARHVSAVKRTRLSRSRPQKSSPPIRKGSICIQRLMALTARIARVSMPPAQHSPCGSLEFLHRNVG